MRKKMRLTILGILFCYLGMAPCVLAESLSPSQARELFDKGAEAYKQGKYADAVQAYEEILSGGVESGHVYFNLGNSYYKTGKTGKARLNYERACTLIPRDSDLNYNYKFLMSKINQKEYDKKHLAQRILQSVTRHLTLNEWVILLLVACFCFLGISAACLQFQWPRPVLGMAVFLFVLILVTGVSGISQKQSQREYAIVLKETNAMFEPKKESTMHFALKEGFKVKVVKEEDLWFKIQRPDGNLGWVSALEMERIK